MKFKIFNFISVSSTNDVAINLIKKDKKNSGCVYAEMQTKGRGTYGKNWISSKGNLFISIFFHLKENYPPFNEFSVINPLIISEVIKNFCKDKQLLYKMKLLTLLSINFLLSLGAVFLPKAVLFSIVRVYADLRFYVLKKNYKVKKGKQKHNLFANQSAVSTGNLRLTEDRIAKTNRQIDLSLRRIVMDNRKIMKPAITNEEKGLQILAQGQ